MQQDSCETSWHKSSWQTLLSIKKGSKRKRRYRNAAKNVHPWITELQHKLSRENDGISPEDLKFMQVLDNGTKLIDRHYEIPLPLRDDNVRFPNNRLQAEKRFTYLQRNISRNHKFKNDYMTFMKDVKRICNRTNSSSWKRKMLIFTSPLSL